MAKYCVKCKSLLQNDVKFCARGGTCSRIGTVPDVVEETDGTFDVTFWYAEEDYMGDHYERRISCTQWSSTIWPMRRGPIGSDGLSSDAAGQPGYGISVYVLRLGRYQL